jgi:hypothetical protein
MHPHQWQADVGAKHCWQLLACSWQQAKMPFARRRRSLIGAATLLHRRKRKLNR